MEFLDQDALTKIGNLLQDISGDNKIKGEARKENYETLGAAFAGDEQKFDQWSSKKQDATISDAIFQTNGNKRRLSHGENVESTNARKNVDDGPTVHGSWGSVEGIATKTDDYLIAMREKAAIVIQRWYRRVKIRNTAGAAAIKRMMAAKKQEVEARMSYEQKEVCKFFYNTVCNVSGVRIRVVKQILVV